MAQVILYTKEYCPYCMRAKQLFKRKGQPFRNIDIEEEPDQRAVMIEKSGGGTTVPQIFINGKHIGGCDDLYALERRGELDPLLEA